MAGYNSIEISSDCVSNDFFSKIIQESSQQPDEKPRGTIDEKITSVCFSSDVQDFETQNTSENLECLIGTFKDGLAFQFMKMILATNAKQDQQ